MSTALALFSSHQLSQLVDAAPAIGSGVGGTSTLLDIADASVFVKRIPLTDLERDPEAASVVLFLEYIPQNLDAWLTSQLAVGLDAVTAACAMVQQRLQADLAFMNTNGLLHFDAHFCNILTDGHRLYLADLGLATSPRFDLSTDERDFLALNASHDAGYAVRELLNWVVANVVGIPAPDTGGPVERCDYIHSCAAGAPPADAPEPVAELISRYAPAAAIMNDFYWDVYGVSRTRPRR